MKKYLTILLCTRGLLILTLHYTHTCVFASSETFFPEEAKSEYEPSAGHSHSHAYKEKDKAKMKKKDDKSYRPPSKHLLGELFAHMCIARLY